MVWFPRIRAHMEERAAQKALLASKEDGDFYELAYDQHMENAAKLRSPEAYAEEKNPNAYNLSGLHIGNDYNGGRAALSLQEVLENNGNLALSRSDMRDLETKWADAGLLGRDRMSRRDRRHIRRALNNMLDGDDTNWDGNDRRAKHGLTLLQRFNHMGNNWTTKGFTGALTDELYNAYQDNLRRENYAAVRDLHNRLLREEAYNKAKLEAANKYAILNKDLISSPEQIMSTYNSLTNPFEKLAFLNSVRNNLSTISLQTDWNPNNSVFNPSGISDVSESELNDFARNTIVNNELPVNYTSENWKTAQDYATQMKTKSYKIGGNINKFQQGGTMDEQQLQLMMLGAIGKLAIQQAQGDLNAAMQMILQLMSGLQLGDQLIQQAVLQVAQQSDPNELMQLGQQIAQSLQSQQAQVAAHGAKLNYIHQLNTGCPDGLTPKYFKVGGRICKKCMGAKMQEGGEVEEKEPTAKRTYFDQKGKKIIKKACGGKH